jgi:hypothetical protein
MFRDQKEDRLVTFQQDWALACFAAMQSGLMVSYGIRQPGFEFILESGVRILREQ